MYYNRIGSVIAELKTTQAKPRVHPNGFIQLDINEKDRLHVWHPSLTVRQKTFSPVHNHIFSFHSEIYVGRLINVCYQKDAAPTGTHEEWRVQLIEGEETKLVRQGEARYHLDPVEMEVMFPGDLYFMPKWEFHEILTNEPTMTVIRKKGAVLTLGPNSGGASVMVPVGEEPDNDFRRGDVDTDALWDLILETARRGGLLI